MTFKVSSWLAEPRQHYSEHAIGLLKGRFQSLRELRIQITLPKHHRWAIHFIRCCITLHNLVVRLEGGDFDAGFREELFEVGRGYAAPRAPDMTDDEDSGGSDDDLRQA